MVHGWRDHAGLVFFDLRDRSGLMQVKIDQATAPESHALARNVRVEWVIQVTGTVVMRPEGMVTSTCRPARWSWKSAS